jgi:DNA repair exonuclease SbcCD nuclease subunit
MKREPKYIRGGVIGDGHYTSRPPVSRKGYKREFDALMGEQLEVWLEYGVEFWCWVGDIFHSKLSVPHADVRHVMHWVRRYADELGPGYAIAGNHDLEANRTESVPKQPIGTLFESGLLIDVSKRAEIVKRGKRAVYINGKPYTGQVVVPNTMAPVAAYQEGDATPRVLGLVTLLHEEVYKPPPMVIRDWTRPRCVCNGHLHDIQKVTKDEHGNAFVWTGALMRTSRAEAEMKPATHIMHFGAAEGLKVYRVALETALSPEEAFSEKSENPLDHLTVEANDGLKELVEEIRKGNVIQTQCPHELLDAIGSEGGYAASTVKRAHDIVDNCA